MKLLEAIKNYRGSPFEIPDCSRDDLPQLFIDLGFKVGAEIGVYKGEYTKKFLDTGLSMYGIDPWLDYPSYKNTGGQKRIDFLYEHAQRSLSSYPNCKIIRKTSMEALSDFEDESLDFVYIDANHLLKYVIDDICEWSKKVKKGGVVAGHDYFYEKRDKINLIHVPFAIKAFTESYGIENWFVLGSEKAEANERRDKWRSWMWVKGYNEPSPLIKA